MSKLTKQFPELKINESNLQEVIKGFLERRNYSEFHLIEKSLEFTPFFLIEFDAFSEEKHKEEKIVSSSFSGTAYLNAFSKQLDDSAEEFFKGKLTNQLPEKTEFKILSEKIPRKNAEKLFCLLISQQKKIPKENIVVSSIEEFFLPEWLVKIKLEENEFPLKINALTAEVTGEIPKRKKSLTELTKETVQELKQPSAWKQYTLAGISSATGTAKTAKSKETTSFAKTETSFLSMLKENLLHNEFFQVIILIIILLILIFLAF